jgi:hypothetical protein
MKGQICPACPARVVRTEVVDVDVDVVAKVMSFGGCKRRNLKNRASGLQRTVPRFSQVKTDYIENGHGNWMNHYPVANFEENSGFTWLFQRRSHTSFRAPLTHSRGTRPRSLRAPGFKRRITLNFVEPPENSLSPLILFIESPNGLSSHFARF